MRVLGETTDRTRGKLRVLGRLRLSVSRDESTSIEKQRNLIELWAEQSGHEIVGWAVDDGVSGSVDPFETPGLGPWLSGDRIHEWDILCAWKLDRLARRSIPLHKLFGFLEDHGKTLVCTAENIDLSNWLGKTMASIIAGLAEGELEAIRERQSSTRKQLRSMGRFAGGVPPYGYKSAPGEDGGRVLVQNPETAPVVLRMVGEILEGIPAEHVVRRLNGDGVPSSRGANWTSNSLRHALRHRTLVGHLVHKGTTVRDSDGEPVLATTEPILTWEQFQKVQGKLDNRQRHTRHHRTSPLLGIVKCWVCGGNMHFSAVNSRTQKAFYRYFQCRNKCVPSVDADWVIGSTHEAFEDDFARYEVLEKQVTYPKDHSARIAEIREALQGLAEVIGSLSAEASAAFVAQAKALGKELEGLEAEHSETARVKWIPTGKTYRDLWDAADEQGKRSILLNAGITVRVRPGETHFIVPGDLRELLTGQEGFTQ